ncbi:hypothetical protein GGR57DRAFT_507208 [Xylariaceae sp. FL1272]|nr:hypothetical protein GGR57DRAFT_507208 [Xylariaceae sp. FL1272]
MLEQYPLSCLLPVHNPLHLLIPSPFTSDPEASAQDLPGESRNRKREELPALTIENLAKLNAAVSPNPSSAAKSRDSQETRAVYADSREAPIVPSSDSESSPGDLPYSHAGAQNDNPPAEPDNIMADQKADNEGGEQHTFSEGDVKFITNFFRFLKGRPTADWDAFAKEMKLKDAGVAQARYRHVHKKHRVEDTTATDNGEGPSTAGALTSPSGVQKKKATPRKAQAKKTGKLAAALAKDEGNDTKMEDAGKKEDDGSEA